MKKIKIPCSFQTISSPSEDKRLVKCLIKVQHDKENLNGSYFDKADIERCAFQSLLCTPILGSVVFDEDSEEYRLNGHDMEYKIVKNEDGYDLKVHHIEKIYGFVPPDAEIYFEYDEEKDKHYLMTEGYLWKNYMDELEDVLNKKDGQTQVSMEISANDFFEREDGLTQITDYVFEGISMLGIKEAMEGANLQLFSEDTMSKLKTDIEELVQVYSLEKEEEHLEQVENIELNEEVAEEVSETCSSDDIAVDSVCEEKIEEPTVILEAEIKDATKEELEQLKEKYELVINELNTLKDSYSELVAKFEEMKDYEELKEFKQSYDKAQYESEIKEITSKFELDEEEYQELQEKALNGEIAKEQYEKELYCILGMKQMTNKSNFSQVDKSTHEVKVKIENKTSPIYGELGKKYSK